MASYPSEHAINSNDHVSELIMKFFIFSVYICLSRHASGRVGGEGVVQLITTPNVALLLLSLGNTSIAKAEFTHNVSACNCHLYVHPFQITSLF